MHGRFLFDHNDLAKRKWFNHKDQSAKTLRLSPPNVVCAVCRFTFSDLIYPAMMQISNCCNLDWPNDLTPGRHVKAPSTFCSARTAWASTSYVPLRLTVIPKGCNIYTCEKRLEMFVPRTEYILLVYVVHGESIGATMFMENRPVDVG
jgi:hypothetical protein